MLFLFSIFLRYYLKNNHCTDPLVPDDSASELLRDTHTSFLQLQSAEIAAQLTLQDFRIFTAIRSTEYMDDLFELESKYGREHLQEFTDVRHALMPAYLTVHDFPRTWAVMYSQVFWL